jgi:hypothetical protein
MKKNLFFITKPRIKLICAISISILSAYNITCSAQETFVASGNNSETEFGSISYSIGQVADKSTVGENGSVNQGVQQAVVVSIVNELEEAKDIEIVLTAFPNPATNTLLVKTELIKTGSLSYNMFDMAGNLVHSGTLESNECLIDISNLSTATYFLFILKESKEIKSFKIIKN